MDSDMSVEVRVAAFDAIGKTKMVSVEFLLQTLSKKVLDAMEEDNYLGQGSREQREDSASSGSLVHGLEDEYHEVRDSACCPVQKLTALSSKFSGEAINLLIDMLNDDSMAVQLHALETMQLMANRGHLYSLFESSACAHGEMIAKLHLDTDMFLGPLTDSSSLIRDAVRKVLKSMKLKNMELFRLSVYGLVESMKSYHQIEPASDGKLGFDGAPVSAFLLLAIAAPLCHVKNRACKGELAMLASEPSGISATVALTEQYPREIAFQVKLLQPEICCYEITMRKSSAVLFQIEHLQEEAYMKPSSFVTELEKATVNTVSSITPDEGTQSFLSWEIRAELTVPAYQGGRKLWLK